MHEYEPLFFYREDEIDGIKPWLWQQTDSEAWTGPLQNWNNAHRANILKYVPKFDCCVQAGGNHGMYPRLLAEMFQSVYTFEPDPWNYFALVNNCQKDNIVKLQAALGDENKMISVLRAHMGNTGMHQVEDNPHGNIPMLRLDDFKFRSLDFLHLDVEGYEEKILLGGLKTLEQHHPVIFCERGEVHGIVKLLGQLGYTKKGYSEMDTIYTIT